jgi:O-antigen/teichoic acid export membrane protein
VSDSPSSEASVAATANTTRSAQHLVLRNALVSFLGQLVGMPLSMVVSAVMARYLGASNFGELYVAGTIAGFGFMFVDWGHGGVLPAQVARDRSLAGDLLGSSLAWRAVVAAVVYAALGLGCVALGYDRNFQIVLALVSLQCLLQTFASACQDTIRGLERTDVGAVSQIGTQLLAVCLVIPTLLLGGGLRGVLVAQAIGSTIVLGLVLKVLRPVGIPTLKVSGESVRTLLRHGTPFLFFAFAMAAQPNVDAIMLSRLAPPEVVGWHAAARRLVGALVLPASLVVGALYPTLSRLHVEDKQSFVQTARDALRATTVLAVPVGMCCALYREIGIQIFSKTGYAQAHENLLALSLFLVLVYFSMPLGVAILAAGKQRLWAAVQFMCVLVSAALDPWLVPWFQRHYGNGGLGICSSNVASELLMVGAGLVLVNPGVLDRRLVLTVLRTLVAGGVMAGVGYLLRNLSSFLAAPIAVASYGAALWLVGGLDRNQLAQLRRAIQRKKG